MNVPELMDKLYKVNGMLASYSGLFRELANFVGIAKHQQGLLIETHLMLIQMSVVNRDSPLIRSMEVSIRDSKKTLERLGELVDTFIPPEEPPKEEAKPPEPAKKPEKSSKKKTKDPEPAKKLKNDGNEDLFDKMKRLIADRLEVNQSMIEPNSSFRQDLGADSLDTYELVYAIEEELGITIPDEKANEFNTVRDALEYIQAQLDSK